MGKGNARKSRAVRRAVVRALAKCPTGIVGLDEITQGGLPRGRPTLVCGGAGCGKSLLGIEFLVRGITQFNEPGVLMTFEEPVESVTQNVASLGFDLPALIDARQLVVDHVQVERSEIEETGEYDLDGLFIRLNYAIDSVGAKRVVLDTLESLFSGLSNQAILRAELRRLFNWLKEKGVTAIITGEQGEATLTRQGLEEYVSDCVIFLSHRIIDQISTRRLRVVKYRGSTHGTNEFPYLIDRDGICILPVTSLGLDHPVTNDRISSGVKEIDSMLGGKGYYRGSSVLVAGTAGMGKSTLAAHYIDAACKRSERSLYVAFEESPAQIMRNMKSVGIDLARHVAKGVLRFHAARPTLYGLESHLAALHKQIMDFRAQVVVIDPISNLMSAGNALEAQAMLLRLIDFLKMNQISVLFTNLVSGGGPLEATSLGVSSLMDSWLLIRDIELNGERNRGLFVLKSRGMPHSNQIREMLITSEGVKVVPAYLGTGQVLTGSARLAQEAKEVADEAARRDDLEQKQHVLERKRREMEQRIRMIKAEFADAEKEIAQATADRKRLEQRLQDELQSMAKSRKVEPAAARSNHSSPADRKETRH